MTDDGRHTESFKLSQSPAQQPAGFDLVSLSQPTVQRAADNSQQQQSSRQYSVTGDILSPFKWVFSELGKWWQSSTTPSDPAKPVGDPTGLIYAAPDVSKSTIYQVADTLYHLPAPMFDALQKHKTKVEIYSSAAEDPTGDPMADAYYDDKQNRIAIYANSGILQEATAHELAHLWDGPNFSIQSQPGYKQAFAADLQDLQMGYDGANWSQIKSSGILADPPAINGVKSGDVFAEIVAGLNGYNQSGMPYKMEQAFPRTANYLYNTLVQQSQQIAQNDQQQGSSSPAG